MHASRVRGRVRAFIEVTLEDSHILVSSARIVRVHTVSSVLSCAFRLWSYAGYVSVCARTCVCVCVNVLERECVGVCV